MRLCGLFSLVTVAGLLMTLSATSALHLELHTSLKPPNSPDPCGLLYIVQAAQKV
jgi:hypothetical protein